jgi:hypothetical protein
VIGGSKALPTAINVVFGSSQPRTPGLPWETGNAGALAGGGVSAKREVVPQDHGLQGSVGTESDPRWIAASHPAGGGAKWPSTAALNFPLRPGHRRAYPQIRFAALAESGTHVPFGSQPDARGTGEITLAKRVLPCLQEGMLCLTEWKALSPSAGWSPRSGLTEARQPRRRLLRITSAGK